MYRSPLKSRGLRGFPALFYPSKSRSPFLLQCSNKYLRICVISPAIVSISAISRGRSDAIRSSTLKKRWKRALAPSSSRAGREDNRGTRQSTVGEKLGCGSRGVRIELPPSSCADRVFITRSSAMIASTSVSFHTPPKRQAYNYTALTSALKTSRQSRLPS